MRRTDKEIADQTEQYAILDGAEVVRLGLVENGEAYIVPVNFCRIDNRLYFHSSAEGRKASILKDAPLVSFQAEAESRIVSGGDVACRWTTAYRSVHGRAQVRVLTDADEKIKALAALMKRFSGADHSFTPEQVNNILLVELTITKMTGKRSPSQH